MGNETSSPITRSHRDVQQGRQVHGQNERPLSNLSVLMQQQEEGSASNQQSQNVPQPHDRVPPMRTVDEADSGSGPVLFSLGSSNPGGSKTVLPLEIHRHLSTGNLCDDMHRTRRYEQLVYKRHIIWFQVSLVGNSTFVYFPRCMSSKELVTLAPPSGSPYAAMLHRKEELEFSTRERMMMLMKARDGTSQASSQQEPLDESTSSSSRKRQGTNESRNRRRSEHYHAVVNDLCEVVADLFLAESKLIKPSQYGVLDDESSPSRRSQILNAVQRFVSALPTRYALGADTPSEVLLHMRLMAAARAEKTKAVIHIHSLQDDSDLHRKVSSMSAQQRKSLRLVTISCSDANGLLERITKLLSSGGSRVLDADVMLSSDGIALDRFVVEMTGRLRLDKLATSIESFLKRAFEVQVEAERSTTSSESSPEFSGSIYFKETKSPAVMSSKAIQEDLLTAVPLVDVLESSGHSPRFPLLRKTHSMPPQLNVQQLSAPDFRLEMKHEPNYGILGESELPASEIVVQPDLVLEDPQPQSNRQRRPLVNRSATYDLDGHSAQQETEPVDYLTVPGSLPDEDGTTADSRRVPLIPFEELMLIETIGTGRVSTIYRAVWQHQRSTTEGLSNARMVALKVAMVHNGDTSHVDELRREADIAARLSHPNVCDLKGVAADPDCFCLAYEYCEGGSLHSLLSDPSRYYEYLPIALDIANGMAYLHSRNIIHRDLKTSNILLTRDHRAKICDFGMSIMNMGQELTAETGTYRYMVSCS
jgi:hypothetical protein